MLNLIDPTAENLNSLPTSKLCSLFSRLSTSLGHRISRYFTVRHTLICYSLLCIPLILVFSPRNVFSRAHYPKPLNNISLPVKQLSSRVTTKNNAINSRTERKNVTVQIINGQQRGSGILIRDPSNNVVVVTNKHVVGSSQYVCVVLMGTQNYPAIVLSTRSHRSADISFIFVPELTTNQPTAMLRVNSESKEILPLIATGYDAISNKYIETLGVSIPLLSGVTLEAGYTLTYSNTIDKGMSGGGIFSSDGHLLGLNGIHSDPIWAGDWFDINGQKVNELLGHKLDAVSIGISSDTIIAEMATINGFKKFPARTRSCPRSTDSN